MRHIKRLSAVAVLGFMLAGCAGSGYSKDQFANDLGSVIGTLLLAH